MAKWLDVTVRKSPPCRRGDAEAPNKNEEAPMRIVIRCAKKDSDQQATAARKSGGSAVRMVTLIRPRRNSYFLGGHMVDNAYHGFWGSVFGHPTNTR